MIHNIEPKLMNSIECILINHFLKQLVMKLHIFCVFYTHSKHLVATLTKFCYQLSYIFYFYWKKHIWNSWNTLPFCWLWKFKMMYQFCGCIFRYWVTKIQKSVLQKFHKHVALCLYDHQHWFLRKYNRPMTDN